MGTLSSFMGQFGGTPNPELVPASAPNALGAFMNTFSTLTDESYWFYDHTIELRYDKEAHAYFRVDPELGNLIELWGVTTVLKKAIDRSLFLVPWGAKMCVEKILRTITLSTTKDEFGDILLAPITLGDFTKLVMDAKGAHKEKLESAGDIGKMAHECLEHSIQHAIDHTNGVVLKLHNYPEDVKAALCAMAGFSWMQTHNVRWIKTECKIYSREHQYAGTLDGKALVDSCDDPACCTEKFKDSLSVIDWKSSNDLHVEYIFQAAGAYCHAEIEEYGEDIQNCFILRLGKNEDEAGKFEPWRIPARDFPEAFQGFLFCLQLVELLEAVKERMSTQKKEVRVIKKQQKAEQKEIAKMKAKVDKAAEKAQLKLDRAAEKERIKADAKRAREEMKNAKADKALPVCESVRIIPQDSAQNPVIVVAPQAGGILVEESLVVRKPFVIPEEG